MDVYSTYTLIVYISLNISNQTGVNKMKKTSFLKPLAILLLAIPSMVVNANSIQVGFLDKIKADDNGVTFTLIKRLGEGYRSETCKSGVLVYHLNESVEGYKDMLEELHQAAKRGEPIQIVGKGDCWVEEIHANVTSVRLLYVLRD